MDITKHTIKNRKLKILEKQMREIHNRYCTNPARTQEQEDLMILAKIIRVMLNE